MNNPSLPVYPDLPRNGKLHYWCSGCDGYIPGAPIQQIEYDLFGFSDSVTQVWNCVRCGKLVGKAENGKLLYWDSSYTDGTELPKGQTQS